MFVNITKKQKDILDLIYKNPGITPEEIKPKANINLCNVYRNIKVLDESGYVKKEIGKSRFRKTNEYYINFTNIINMIPVKY